MKKILALSFIVILSFNPIHASHIVGGELTWECISQGTNKGKFIFHAKKYRRCCISCGLTVVNPTIINPLGNNFAMAYVKQYVIDFPCYDPLQQIDCYGGTALKQEKAIEVWVFKSGPITISGTIPSTGAEFYFVDCCRPGGIANTTSTGNLHTRAIMYPYNPGGVTQVLGNSVTNGCYDNSPQFVADPLTNVCNKFQISHSIPVEDPDGDSLSFHWLPSLTASLTSVAYKSGFSTTNQLPSSGVPVSPSNVPASLNSLTGLMTFTPYDTGDYMVTVEVRSYRDGILIASVMREIRLGIFNCAPLPPPFPPNTYNSPPNVSFLHNTITHPNNLYDTVYAGDLVEFNLETEDYEFLPGFLQQKVTVKPSNGNFGNGYTHSTSGCNNPPCITMDTTLSSFESTTQSWQDLAFLDLKVKWRTSCAHLSYKNGLAQPTTHNIQFKVTDDYCSVPGVIYPNAYITILPDTSNTAVSLVDSIPYINNTATVNWEQYTGSGFNNYFVYKYNTQLKKFEIIRKENSITNTSYADVTNSEINRYYVTTDSADCPRDPVYSTLNLGVSQDAIGNIYLNYNSPIVSINPVNLKYYIYSSVNGAGLVLTDSTTSNTYTDILNSCADSVDYRVVAYSNGNYFTNSNTKRINLIQPQNFIPNLNFTLTDPDGKVYLSWDTLTIPKSAFISYQVYVASDSIGPYTFLDSIDKRGTSYYVDSFAGADTNILFYYIKANVHSGCLATNVLTKRSNILKTNFINYYLLTNGIVQLNWSRFFTKGKTAGGKYQIYKRFLGSSWMHIGTTPFGVETFEDSLSYCNTDIEYKVEMDTSDMKVVTQTILNVSGFEIDLELEGDSIIKGWKGTNQNWYLNDSLYAEDTNSINLTLAGTYKYTATLSNGCEIFSKEYSYSPTGVSNRSEASGFMVKPNPNNGQFKLHIDLNTGDQFSYEVISITGKVILSSPLNNISSAKSHNEVINIAEQPKGLYLLKVNVNDKVYTKKIILQ